jgi:thiamine-phosphate pyrophosphorylase
VPLPFPDSGLYVITGAEKRTHDQIVAAVAAAIKGGARVVQYRDKQTGSPKQRLSLARRLLSVCRTAHVPLIINDDIDLAARAGADGVHLGKEDSAIEEARKSLGSEATIGVSCYASPARACRAQAQGATYVAFGRFFPSRSKPHATPADPALLQEARLRIPIVAIGGITPENGGELLAAGANLLAVIESVSAAPDPEQAAFAFRPLFTK